MDLRRVEEILRADLPPADPTAREQAHARLLAKIEREAPRRYRKRLLTLVGSVAAAVVAFLVVQALLPPGQGGPPPTAAVELKQLGVLSTGLRVADFTPGSYLYVRLERRVPLAFTSTVGDQSYTLLSSATTDTWTAEDGSGTRIIRYDEVSFASDADRVAWMNAGSPAIPESGQRVAETFPRGELPVYPVERLPADPGKLRLALDDGTVIEPAPGDANLLFTIGTLMAQQTLPSDVREAMFEVAAQIPGVRVDDGASDPIGRAATAVSVTDDSGTTTLFFDPADASLLATSRTHPASETSTATLAWQAYEESGVVQKAGALPAKP
jgi:hypothetical protein